MAPNADGTPTTGPQPAPDAGTGPVSVSLDSHLARIEFHDPASGNALNPTTLTALVRALESASNNPECRVILIHGKGDDFCRGLDFQFVADMKSEPQTQFIGTYQKLLRLMGEVPQPVIAYVDGAVRAGGVGVAVAADLVLATQRSMFALTEVIFGLVPFNVMPFLLRRVTPAKAKYLVLTARDVDAAEAHRIGLIDELVRDAESAEKAIRRLMKQFLRASPHALGATKSFIDLIASLTMEDACMSAHSELEAWFQDPANPAVLRDFQAGNTPPWFAKYKPKDS